MSNAFFLLLKDSILKLEFPALLLLLRRRHHRGGGGGLVFVICICNPHCVKINNMAYITIL